MVLERFLILLPKSFIYTVRVILEVCVTHKNIELGQIYCFFTPVKWYVAIDVEFQREYSEGESRTVGYLKSIGSLLHLQALAFRN
jgi:hypothetical protein